MTQIIAAITEDYIVLASDRRLTHPTSRQVVDDDTCKLVSLCNKACVAYTGLATLEGQPTHEWIACRLADATCRHPDHAVQVLASAARNALPPTGPYVEQSFLLAGWVYPSGHPEARPFLWLVTNARKPDGTRASAPVRDFMYFHSTLGGSNLDISWAVVGVPLKPDRANSLHRYCRRLARHRVSAKHVLFPIIREIVHSSTSKGSTVGSKVLSCCLPRAGLVSPLSPLTPGRVPMVASEPNTRVATFLYSDASAPTPIWYGPTNICGPVATTDLEVEHDPATGDQSVGFRILRFPPKSTPAPATDSG
jgi:hypothetical protein